MNAARLWGLSCGAAHGIQAAANGYLARVLGSSMQASLVSFAGGVLALSALCLIMPAGRRDLRNYLADRAGRKAPLWVWAGGLLGAFSLTLNILATSVLGPGVAVSAVQTGQMGGGLLIDHFGLLGIRRDRVTLRKLAGVVLMLAGLLLVHLG